MDFLSNITKIGEGFAGPDAEQNLPIDIPYNKALEWMVDRRKIPLKWQQILKNIRSKINNAVKDMPENDEMLTLLKDDMNINYFDCLDIKELLKVSEKDTKNVFGQYSSKRMADWNEIINSYQTENLYLAEIAQILIRNTNYEIPALHKLISKNNIQIKENEIKESEYNDTILSYKSKFKQACTDLNIQGENVRDELKGLLIQLPEIYDKVIKFVQQDQVKNTIDFYKKIL